MRSLLALRLAAQNLRRNYQTYGPFLLASSLLTFALYAFMLFPFNPGISQVAFANGFLIILNFGLIVIGIFTALFLFYANSFLIKRRKKELGMYGILGLERRHVIGVLFFELALSYLITMLIGLGLGMLLARLLFLILRALTRLDIPLTGGVNPTALRLTALLMGGLFLLLFVYNALQVRLVKPIDMLHSQQQGEKEPQARWLLALLGFVCLIAGYVIALRVDNPINAVTLFFIAVLLVIAGTYLTFLTGSIALLKALKGRKRYYYTSKHFVSVSGMLYRMKQNAAGLASITILCTMAMVTIGTTAALYLGSTRMLNSSYPSDIYIRVQSEQEAAAVLNALTELEETTEAQPVNRHLFRKLSEVLLVRDGEMLSAAQRDEDLTWDYYNLLRSVSIMTQEEYNALQGTSVSLGDREIAWFGDETLSELTMLDQVWKVQQLSRPTVPLTDSNNVGYVNAVLVVRDWETAAAVSRTYSLNLEREAPVVPRYVINYNLTGDQDARLAYGSQANQILTDTLYSLNPDGPISYSFSDKGDVSADWYSFYGSFLFVGVFLGLVFMTGMALIIYFKQISEGYQDHDRYIILQKVGMSQSEVRSAVRRQVLLVFFLPLTVALCHVAGSLKMIALMLQVFGLIDVPFISLCSLGAAVVVALVYLLFYRRTAKSYYKLVRFEGGEKQ